jgi:hypothetical protein
VRAPAGVRAEKSSAGGEGQGIRMDAGRRPHAARRILAAIVIALATAAHSAAQPLAEPKYTRQTVIRVPFVPNTSGRLKRVMLYVSTDSGREWQPCAEAAPTDRYFRDYNAPGDGTYWFAVRSVDTFDQHNPPSLAQLTPEVKVIVDTRAPIVTLKQRDDPRPGVVTVEWDVRDDHLDPSRFVIEYRVPGRTDWTREDRTQPNATGTLSWNLDPGLRMDVRLRAADRAGNVGDATLSLGAGATGRAATNGGGNSTVTSDVQYVNTRTINIKCNVSVGISGRKDFDLWYTRDVGRAWVKAPKKLEDPGIPTERAGEIAGSTAAVKLIFEADADGLYGFTVVLRNGVGVGDPDPRPGDPPRFSVVVDTIAPTMRLKVTPGTGADLRNVTVQWEAQDNNLGDRPVLLEYAEVKSGTGAALNSGDWKPLPNLPGRQDRSGIHVWTIGREGPFHFVIRASAADKAQNKTEEVIKDPIIIDLEHPRVDVIGIESNPKPP